MLVLNKIQKSFNKNLILDNIDLIANDGDIISITGCNGSGKSTLLKIIAGLVDSDEGTICKNGHKIGALIENPAFLENETLKYNLQFLIDLTNKNRNFDLDSICEKYSLDINDKRKMKKYSIGMRQKAGIIQAIMENQDLLLLDEPIRGLDNEGINAFVDTIKAFKTENKIVIICSHNPIKGILYTCSYHLDSGKLQKL